MAKAPTPAPNGAPDPARPTEPVVRVTSPGGPHWRAGRQFGREPVDLTEADIRAMAKEKGVEPEDIAKALTSDPHLSVLPASRPITATN